MRPIRYDKKHLTEFSFLDIFLLLFYPACMFGFYISGYYFLSILFGILYLGYLLSVGINKICGSILYKEDILLKKAKEKKEDVVE